MKRKAKKALPKIVTNAESLKSVCQETTLEEGEKIGKLLLSVLDDTPNGAGLAANQIGIQKRVCAVRVGKRKPFFLINPEIVSSFGRVSFVEGCLSFPGKQVITKRYKNIAVRADNLGATKFFTGDDSETLLEVVCIQHEIDHLNGITMFDRSE